MQKSLEYVCMVSVRFCTLLALAYSEDFEFLPPYIK